MSEKHTRDNIISREKLDVFTLENELIGSQKRGDFYSEIGKEFDISGKISKKVKQVRLILMNSSGRIYLQQRSKIKDQNTGRYDKTIGGHVASGDNFKMTMIRECAEELGFPVAIVSADEFKRAIKATPLEVVGIIKKIDYVDNFISERILLNGKTLNQPVMTAMYIGYYDGPIRFADGESSGIEVFTLEELEEDLRNNPDKFTNDIKIMLKKYKSELVSIDNK